MRQPRSHNTVAFPAIPTRAMVTVSEHRIRRSLLDVGIVVPPLSFCVTSFMSVMLGFMFRKLPVVFLRTQTRYESLLHD